SRPEPWASGPRWAIYGTASGPGTYRATPPATSGPMAVPATNAMLAMNEARPGTVCPLRVTITAVAAPVTAPRAIPWAARPANNHSGPLASKKHAEPIAPNITLTRSTGRGPSESYVEPNNKRAGADTIANVA